MVRTLIYILSEVSRTGRDVKELKKEINIMDLEEKFEESFLLSQYLYVNNENNYVVFAVCLICTINLNSIPIISLWFYYAWYDLIISSMSLIWWSIRICPKNIFMFYVYTKAPGDRPLHFSKNK